MNKIADSLIIGFRHCILLLISITDLTNPCAGLFNHSKEFLPDVPPRSVLGFYTNRSGGPSYFIKLLFWALSSMDTLCSTLFFMQNLFLSFFFSFDLLDSC